MINLKKQKKEFCIVFRTFDNDLQDLLREYNKFCLGDHPCYNGKNNTPVVKFDGSKGTKNYLIEPDHIGLLYRKSLDPN